MERITVFGARGFVGRYVSNVLRARGFEVITQPRDDITPPAGGFGTIVWCIGLTANFRNQPIATATAHVGLLANVLSQNGHERVVYLSSTRVYEGAVSTSEDSSLIVRPNDSSQLYNATKIAGESLVFTSHSCANTVIRLSNAIGPREFNRSTFLGQIAKQAIAGHIVLKSLPQTTKDYIWIDDAVRIIADIITDGAQRTYNVASGKQTAHCTWVDALTTITGCSYSVMPDAVDESYPPIEVSRVAGEFVIANQDPLNRVRDIVGVSQ